MNHDPLNRENKRERLHRRAREHRANPIAYAVVRVLFQPFFHVYFRYERIGREHFPKRGPVIVAANHRSFLDPFVIATMARRPMHYVAKTEIFDIPVVGRLVSMLGGFPVQRGAGDAEMIATAEAILERGDILLMFPEGTRTRPGPLGRPRRGVGRLALETGAPVVPVAVIGTEAVRRGWRIRPHKVRIRAGRAMYFPRVEHPSKELAGAVTDRIWPNVMLQWEWLGGMPPLRRVAIIGAGAWGTSLAVCLARAGLEVELGCHSREQAVAIQDTRENGRYLPGVRLPESIRVLRATELNLEGHDMVVLAVPATALPSVLAAHGEHITGRTGLVVACKGLVPPLGTLPSAFAAERCSARSVAVLGGPADAPAMLARGASLILACADAGLARELAEALRDAGLDVTVSSDVTGVELAGVAAGAAVLAAAAATPEGPAIAGAAAGKVFAEVDELARARGGRPETFAGLAGTGELVATGAAVDGRARELLAHGAPRGELGAALGPAAEALDSVPLLAQAAHQARLQTPALDRLAALVQGDIAPGRWAATVTEPQHPKPRAA